MSDMKSEVMLHLTAGLSIFIGLLAVALIMPDGLTFENVVIFFLSFIAVQMTVSRNK